ncbi:squalene synthase HpnC [Parafrankia irregularis]|uniref:Squalene synthase HpnC n=1 Tax=Parafrankia irregularis TaxID=795642 RepID=A0A0S4QQR3_9ACTN|nr:MULTISPECIES: squalene synthase HpnC [Parafrankia]MBE3202734.1 squalene synthase HpnC [Parafrankia sp. CH37]CUU57921.1 squalene synthase HpnC [Parafrankia irregularis]
MTAIDARTGPPRPSAPLGATDLTTPTDQVLLAASAENFPVASRLLPARLREHLNALYVFGRLVDDIGDEAPGDRLALLDELGEDLELIWSGGQPRLPVHQTLARTVRACDLPAEPFRRLVQANRQDQVVTRYDTYDDLVRYCTLSADPIGRMVLGVFGLATPARVALSDRICTALQLAEHFQDVAEDLAAGRIYVPLEDMEAFGVTEADLAAPSASPAVRHLMAFEVARARTLLDSGAPLVGLVGGRLRLAMAGFVGGGRAALDAIRRADYDMLGGAPKAPKPRVAAFAATAWARWWLPGAAATARAAGNAATEVTGPGATGLGVARAGGAAPGAARPGATGPAVTGSGEVTGTDSMGAPASAVTDVDGTEGVR